jgi:hypothetical protein
VKRAFLCFFLLAAAGGCRGVERQHFERLDGSGRAIEAAIEAKVDLPRYRQLLDAFSAELTVAKARVQTARERALVAQYEAAYHALIDLGLVWEAKEARGSDMLPIREDLPARIAREYDLGVNTNEPPSIYASEALHTIWAAAKTRLDAATRSLNGE